MEVCVTLPLVVKAAGCSGGASHTQHRIKGPLPWAPHPQLPQEHPSTSTAAVSDWRGQSLSRECGGDKLGVGGEEESRGVYGGSKNQTLGGNWEQGRGQ